MEKYARTQLKPHPHDLLENWDTEDGEASKAEDALERGVKSRDPKSVVRRVE
jgi:hypothetical protein